MDKHTIFFSHSTKDKDLLLKLKQKLDTITGGVLEIFLSSDGQSIPFGHNWVHKIEQGLDKAKIIFVFITPDSIASNWIYFEAGFAYSKNIEVIPVGIGVDIAILKPPLSLLQGFNIVSGDSLNNFIATINRKFGYHFPENFTQADFDEIITRMKPCTTVVDFSEVFERIEYEILEEHNDGQGGKIKNDLGQIFDNQVSFLREQGVQFSYSRNYGHNTHEILVFGIRITYKYTPSKENQDKIRKLYNDMDRITYRISPYNFKESFDLFNQMMTNCREYDYVYLKFGLNSEYEYMNEIEKISSALSKYPGLFNLSADRVGTYVFRNIKFSIFDDFRWDPRHKLEYVLSTSYKPSDISAEDMFGLIYNLLEKKVIHKKSHN